MEMLVFIYYCEGLEALEDEERIKCLSTAVTSSNTSEILSRVEEDPHITVHELAMSVGVSTGVVHSILIDEQKVSKFVRGAQIIIPKGKTITGELRPKFGPRDMRLLHDNARPHKTKLVESELDSMRVVELDHPPYSPDLTLCNFWLFTS
ncbi:hypothetical protein LOD99_4724 [Oopsacas minuta]|uniref:Transposase n=1 Tax=Oopsacas minuta TaxID=111878 RepID=A0AAV7JTX0_9METZ|nr:hypothetical protein LOD99_4724 [Oopsacas minuta]